MLINKLPFLALVLIIASCNNTDPAASSNTFPSSSADLTVNQYIHLPTGIPSKIPDDRDLFSLYQRFSGEQKLIEYRNNNDNMKPPTKLLGDVDAFWVSDLANNTIFQISAELALISNHAYWFFEEGTLPSLDVLDFIGETFETSIYPSITKSLGYELVPGIDNDIHLYILHTTINGVAGYYSMADEYPKEITKYSNEHKIIYIDPASARIGSSIYFELLTHEFQHAVHWAQDPSEETWINEGLSEVAKNIAGYNMSFVDNFQDNSLTSLINWPYDNSDPLPHYGASSLFLEYLAQYFGGYDNLRVLLESQADGIDGINDFLLSSGYKKSFYEVFGDWIIANYLDDLKITPYYYDNFALNMKSSTLGINEQHSATLPQFSADYVTLTDYPEPFYLYFKGTETNRILPFPNDTDNYCWWSNKGDSIDSTLTTSVDLSSIMIATLVFKAWYSIEQSWDYAYIEISQDEGRTWEIISGTSASFTNPLGRGFGFGYTGQSDGWMLETVDLSPYAGNKVLLRFEYITDESKHDFGLCVDDISIPELNFFDSVDETNSIWLNRGFIRIDNMIPQPYLVQLIEIGDTVSVQEILLDESGAGRLVIIPSETISKRVVTISPVSEKTTLSSSYSISTTKH